MLNWKRIGALLTIGAALAVSAAGQRIAVIDLEQVFREFYKSRIAEEAIRQQAENYRIYLVKLNEQLQQLLEIERTARSNSINYALSGDEQQKAREAAAKAEADVREKRAEIELFIKERGADMRRLEAKKRAEIIDEIKAEAGRRAVAEGFDFVIDRSGRTLNEQPILLYYPPDCDITAAVLRELNRMSTAPTRTDPPLPVPGAAKP